MLPVWTIVLAAGAGRRLASLTGGVPKQFWSGPGGRSLLEETRERFAPVSDQSHTVVVVDASHRAYLEERRRRWGTVIYQPEDRGTAAGVLLSLTPVLAADPDAVVIVTPADHGVEDTARFRDGIREAADAVLTTNLVVVFGVQPTAPCEDYGWILPSTRAGRATLRPIVRFIEKPDRVIAEQLLSQGAAWNTMVVVARAGTLRDLCFEFVPALESVFAGALERPARERSLFFEGEYQTLPRHDFSRDVLTPARNLLTYTWPIAVGWSDLGTPERMLAWHQRGRSPVGREAVTAA